MKVSWWEGFWKPRGKRVPNDFGHESHSWKSTIFSSIGPAIGYYCHNCGASYAVQGDFFEREPRGECDKPCPNAGRAEEWDRACQRNARGRAVSAAKEVVAYFEGGGQ